LLKALQSQADHCSHAFCSQTYRSHVVILPKILPLRLHPTFSS
jgi:hypothetical protein